MAKKLARQKKRASTARKPKPAAKRSTRAKVNRPARRKPAPRRPAAAGNPVREIAKRIVELTVNQNDEESFAIYSDNVESVEPGMPAAVGIDSIRQKFAMWRSMVSDSSWQARNVWVDGNAIIIEWAARVTFAATGKMADLNEVAIHEVVNGKIVRERFYYDRAAMQP